MDQLKRKKPLLVFAHRGEGMAFWEQEKFTPLTHPQAYEGENYFLLFTGEGSQRVFLSLGSFLGQYREQIDEVVHLGLAGALTNRVQLDDIISVRTIYGVDSLDDPLFHSASSNDSKAKWDLVSSHQRISSQQDKQKLRAYAHLVDREGHALGLVCQYHKIPFKIYKLISDFADENTDCQLIQKNAPLFSEKLFHFYQTKIESEVDTELPSFLNDHSFYFTQTSQKLILRLFQNFLSQGAQEEDLPLEDLKSLEISGKERAKRLIDWLEKETNPWMYQWKTKFQKLISPLKRKGIRSDIVLSHEEVELKLSATIRHQKDFEDFKTTLHQFDYSTLERHLNGHDHV